MRLIATAAGRVYFFPVDTRTYSVTELVALSPLGKLEASNAGIPLRDLLQTGFKH